MRKLLSIGVLAAASLLTFWQPAIAEHKASEICIAYPHGPYFYRGLYYPRRVWVRGYWRRGRYYPGYWRYYR